MRNFLKTLRYFFEAIFAYLIYGFFWILPFEIASSLGGRMMRFIGPKMGLSKRMIRHLKLAFPNNSEDQYDDILDKTWTHIGCMIGEYPHLYKFQDKQLFDKYVTIKNQDILRRIAEQNDPIILLSGHVGNWELIAISFFHFGIDLDLIYRSPNNPFMDALFQKARGHGIFANFHPKGKEGAKQLVKSISAGKSIGMLVDQKFNEGIPSDFFGIKAMTTAAPAKFHEKYKSKIYMMRVNRIKNCHFLAEIIECKLPVKAKNKSNENVQQITDHINSQLQNWIAEYPEQWLWMHNRWPKE